MEMPSGREATAMLLKDKTMDVSRDLLNLLEKLEVISEEENHPRSGLYDYSERVVDKQIAKSIKKYPIISYSFFAFMQVLVVVVFAYCEIKEFITNIFKRADGI